MNTFDLYTAAVTVTNGIQLVNPRFANGTFVASVQTVTGRTYSLESTASLAEQVWTAVAEISGDGTVRDLVDAGGAAPRLFYRARVR